MPTRALLECSVCRREMRSTRPVAELRMILAVESPGHEHREDVGCFDCCSPACALTAAYHLIEHAWEMS